MQLKKTSLVGWVARALSALAIVFVSIFAFDAFEGDADFLHKLASFAMHMIPSFVLFVVFLLAWKHELAGGILFLLIGLGMAPFIFSLNWERTHSISVCLEVLALINAPFVIVGALYIMSHRSSIRSK